MFYLLLFVSWIYIGETNTQSYRLDPTSIEVTQDYLFILSEQEDIRTTVIETYVYRIPHDECKGFVTLTAFTLEGEELYTQKYNRNGNSVGATIANLMCISAEKLQQTNPELFQD